MNTAKLKNVQQNLDSFTGNVLSALPVGEETTKQRLLQILASEGRNISIPSFQRAIHKLVESTLIKEVKDGVYLRRLIAEPVAIVRADAAEGAPADRLAEVRVPATPKFSLVKKNPMDRLAELAQGLRALASDIDDAIIDAEEYMQSAKAENVKLNQLKELLKGL